MHAGLRRAVTLVVGALVAALLTLVPQQAFADAQSGTCASGYKLESYTYNYPGYNSTGQKMWNIKWTKRWCYSTTLHRVGTVYSPKPEVEIYGIFDAAWNYEGITSQDAYYVNTDAAGRSYTQAGHVAWWNIKLNHCAVKWALCTSHYYKVGTYGYWDGSKKLILP